MLLSAALAAMLSLAPAVAMAAPPAPPQGLRFGGEPSGRLSAGCGKTPPSAGNPRAMSMVLPMWGGAQAPVDAQRTYLIMLPTNYDPARPLPLSFVFHGAGGNQDAAMFYGLQDAPGARENGIFVFPSGLTPPRYNSGVGWDEPCDGYDMPFVRAMIAQVEEDYCVDTARIFATGFSWGGDMANSVGWCMGDVFRAVGPGSGGEILAGGSLSQGSSVKSAFRLTYTDNDPYYTFTQVQTLYRNAHGCQATGTETVMSNPSGTCTSYTGCGKPVIGCLYPGRGHSLPSPAWAPDLWAFFQSFQ